MKSGWQFIKFIKYYKLETFEKRIFLIIYISLIPFTTNYIKFFKFNNSPKIGDFKKKVAYNYSDDDIYKF